MPAIVGAYRRAKNVRRCLVLEDMDTTSRPVRRLFRAAGISEGAPTTQNAILRKEKAGTRRDQEYKEYQENWGVIREILRHKEGILASLAQLRDHDLHAA